MIFTSDIPIPLVSVVIPCYNHGHYLGKAIESVLCQSHKAVEVIVVDDGSSDNTCQVAQSYGEQVRYVHKQNGGLSAARNTGIEQAKGDYLVFLDADDWLYPTALETNLRYLMQNPQAAFVSGGYTNYIEKENAYRDVTVVVERDHYLQLLQGNYIGMIAAVMFQKWVLQQQRYDETLKACEDYDLYLRIARNHPVLHHTTVIACYRRHNLNMSGDGLKMLKIVLAVLEKQKTNLKSKSELRAYKSGLKIWKDFYCGILFEKRIAGENSASSRAELTMLLKYKKIYFYKYSIYWFKYRTTGMLKKLKSV